MNKQRKTKRQKTNDTLRRAKRAGKRVYNPAYFDGDDSLSLSTFNNGNGYVLPAPNYDNM